MGAKFLLIGATFLLLHSSFVEEWVLFVDPDGQFEIRMPEDINESSKLVATPLGDLKYISLSSQEAMDDEVVQYILSFCDYPEGTFPPDSIELIDLMLEETISASTESVEGELIYQDGARGRTQQGRIWKVVSEKYNRHFKNLAVLDGDRFYNLQVIIPPDMALDNNTDEFFDSFKLTDK